MAHLWRREEAGEWAILPLEGDVVRLDPKALCPIPKLDNCRNTIRQPLLMRRQSSAEDAWVALAPAGSAVRVNGERLTLSVRVLADKDAIQTEAGDCLFFSTEHHARVEAFAGDSARGPCARCKQAIMPNTPVVRCPGCGAVHHQSEELPCWTGYAETPFAKCTFCDRPATLGGEFDWTPEQI